MIKHTTIVTALLVAALAVAAASSGCEVITSVDRSKLEGNGGYGGSTTTTTSSTSTSTTCAGGAMPCAMPSDCPGQSTSCVADTCNAGCCGTSEVAAGMACSDLGGKVCDGSGKCVACLAPTDCAAQATTCLTNTCAGNTCGTSNAQSGTACTDNGGKACDGNGKCVKCVAPTDCTAQTTLCITNTCAGNACGTSNAQSGATCTDNGGKVCDGSGTCVQCLAATDCAAQTTVCKINACDPTAHTCGTTNADLGTACHDSNGVVCDGNGACVATHCTDGVQDADETDVDCGGSCGATCTDTAPQQMCKVPGDCVSGVCKVNAGGTQLFCQPPTCGDGVKNGNETGVDCGGVDCDAQNKLCGAGQGCQSAGDCTSASPCSGTTYTPASTCSATHVCVAGTAVDCTSTSQVCDPTNGCVACNASTDCPATGNECIVNVCNGHACGTMNLGNSHVLSTGQTAGDCQVIVCNGAGSTTAIADGTDPPLTVCASCSATAPFRVPAPTGTSCTADNHPPNAICGDTTVPAIAGTCVQCNADADCPPGLDGGALTCDSSTGVCF